MADLDRCPVCASTHLGRRLGEVECRDCGAVVDSAVPSSAARATLGGFEPADAGPPGLAEEVEQALARVLRRSAQQADRSAWPARPAGIG